MRYNRKSIGFHDPKCMTHQPRTMFDWGSGRKMEFFWDANGNIAAGYMAGSNGISWVASRIAFDLLQSKQDNRPSIEGRSSKNAQYLGWCMGYYNNSPIQQSRNTLRSFKFY